MIVALVGGTLPESTRGGIGSLSASRGSREERLSIPRPTEQARDLEYQIRYCGANRFRLCTFYTVKVSGVAARSDICYHSFLEFFRLSDRVVARIPIVDKPENKYNIIT